MNKKILIKILATILVLLLTFSNVIMLAVYAVGEEIENQQTAVGKTKIEFDAYFKTNDKNVHSMISDINADNLKLYLSIKIDEGSLNDASIRLSESNFKFKEYNDEQELIQSIDLKNNIIYLNGMRNRGVITLELPVEIKKDNNVSLDYFIKETTVTLSGKYLNNSGKEIEISKDIKLILQLHGEEKVITEQIINKYIPFNVNGTKGVLLQSIVGTGIENDNLPVKDAEITIEVPEINDVLPTSVTVIGNQTSYSYNNQTGILTILYNNDIQDNQIFWDKNGLDLYKIVYIYGEEAYTTSEVITKQKVQAVINTYNDTDTVANQISDGNITLTEKINDIVLNTLSINPDGLYKGFLYNNSVNETTYQTTWKSDIGYTNLINEITLSEDGDQYVYNTVSGQRMVPNYAYYKTTSIAKDNFERILGEDGYIDIYNEEGNKIGQIDKNSNLDENNNYVFNYINEINIITIKTSKPAENIMGEELVLNNYKAIKSSTRYSSDWLKAFNKIKTTLNNVEKYINLEEIETAIEAYVNKNLLSTAIANNVEFTVVLRTDSPRYQLYKDPVIDIKLPSYVNVELGNVDVFYANGDMSVLSKNIILDNEGNKIIRIVLSGEQTEYTLNSASKGINLFVSANLSTSKFMASQEEIIEVICTNRKDSYTAKSNTKMNFMSESGILMANSISNYNLNESITSLKGDLKVGSLEMNAVSKTATMDLTVINNEDSDISGVVILGRVPFEGNKTVVKGQDLGSTFTLELKSYIAANGIDATIYYSENGFADIDLQKVENGWTVNATTNSKSYLIVFNEAFEKGKSANFKYNVTIPANLGTNEVAYSNYAVYYNNQTFESPIVGVATEFVMLNQYRSQLEQQNESTTYVVANNAVTGEELIDVNTEYYKETAWDEQLGVNETFNYMITIKNISERNLSNINFVNVLDQNVEFITCNVYDQNVNNNGMSYNIPTYDNDSHNINWKINKLPSKQSITIIIQVRAIKYKAAGINNQCIVSGNDIYIVDSKLIEMKSPADISATMAGSISGDILEENQIVTYTITIKNSGNDIAALDIVSDMPEGIKLKEVCYYKEGIKNEVNIENEQQLYLPKISISPNSGIKILMNAEIETLPEDISQREIEIFALISGVDINIKTDSIKYTVKSSKTSIPENPTENIVKKKISGYVWNDENKNGKKDTSELGISNVIAKLFNSNGQVIKEVTTDNNGKYLFEDLNKGTYIIMFEYDSKLYSITEYKNDNVIEDLNSDAKEAIYNGKKVALTDNLLISDSSKSNINLGLYKNSIFDLKLDKYIENITIQNNNGTTTYNYVNTDFAKVEIPAKYLSSSTVIIEYKFVVTNEGDIPGYLKQIVDYLPQDLKFSSELNKNWYANTDGYLYSSVLTNELINPGETKEINLILTKKMTETNTGLVTNQAEIAESYNEQGIEEYDSVQANKNQNEDDIGVANLIIGVKTGGVVIYITITLICIVVLALGIYLIDKKVLRGIK